MGTFIMANFWVIVLCVMFMLIDPRLAASYVAIIVVWGVDNASNGWLILVALVVAWCLDTRQQQFWNFLYKLAKEKDSDNMNE